MPVRTNSFTLASVALLAIAASGCSAHKHGNPEGYQRLGTAGGATVYGQLQGSYVSLLVEQAGTTVCNARGAIGPSRAPAICNGAAGSTYVYAIPVARSSNKTPLAVCSNITGQRSTLTRIATPDTWVADLAVRIDPADAGPFSSCS